MNSVQRTFDTHAAKIRAREGQSPRETELPNDQSAYCFHVGRAIPQPAPWLFLKQFAP
jgi:hypothetical protein